MRKIAKRISKAYKKVLPYTHVFKELVWALKYLKLNSRRTDRQIGVMRVDGHGYHGGLTDRFKGAVSWWNYCEKNGLDFRIYYVFPFKLTDYVVPNEYDWRIDQDDIPDNIKDTRIFYGRGEKGYRLDKLHTHKSVWYYGNMDLGAFLDYPPYNQPWGEIFKKLFKPSELLEFHLKKQKEKIGGEYIAVVYRFQNLLGDFNESNLYKTISEKSERQKLIDKALVELEKIHDENVGMKVLVTSDSISFLEEASRKSYAYVIPGKIEHMDFTDTDTNYTQLKSFLDFFMIAEAKKVYSVVIGDMYSSQFPTYAESCAKFSPHKPRMFEECTKHSP